METMTYVGTLSIITCGVCQIKFAIPSDLKDEKLKDGTRFYCPMGCKIQYIHNENKKLKDEIDSLNRRIEYKNQIIQDNRNQIQQLNYSVRAQKAAKTKIMNRVKNGVCPCCNRTFKDLQNHFKTKHPELLTEL